MKYFYCCGIFINNFIEIGTEGPCTSGTTELEIEGCCTAKAPCGFGEGDCDNDLECKGDLICGQKNCGTEFPWSGSDCCTASPGNPLLLS